LLLEEELDLATGVGAEPVELLLLDLDADAAVGATEELLFAAGEELEELLAAGEELEELLAAAEELEELEELLRGAVEELEESGGA
jgi:hypothetical protein